MARVNKRAGHILDAAEAALPADRFRAFRRIVLRQLGDDELGADLDQLLRSASGQDGNG